MDLNVYSVEWLAHERLAEARASVAREAWLRSLRAPRQPWRVTLGLALIGLGRRFAEDGTRRHGDEELSEAR